MTSPSYRARLGSTKEGTQHWWVQRVTAIALTPLMLWFVISLLLIARADYPTAFYWMSEWQNTVLMIVMLLLIFYHGALGMQVIIEDYIHDEWMKHALIIAVKLGALVLALVTILAVLRIHLTPVTTMIGGGHG